jgi:carboxymethylenebutenolidase
MLELLTVDGPMGLYESLPAGDKPAQRAVIVIQEAFGVNDHIKSVTDRFAGEGYHAVAPEIFHRAGGGTASYDDFSKVLPLFAGLDDAGLLVDVDATLEHLKQAGFDPAQVAIVGFCMGGRVTFLVAAERSLGAAAGFYGGGIVTGRFPQFPPLVDKASSMKTPWLGLFGDQDESIPVDDVTLLDKALSEAGADHEIVRYPDAGHGFHCDARPGHYNEAAAGDAWQRTLDWFARHLPISST